MDTTTPNNPTVRYTDPGLDADHTLAALVGDPRWRLMLICNWGERTLTFEPRLASDNGVPMKEWHGHAQAFVVPIVGKADALRLIEEIDPLVARVCDGYRSGWYGSNHVSKLTAGAKAALEKLDRAIQYFRHDDAGPLWAAADWLQADPPAVDATATDEELATLEGELQDTAHNDHGLSEYLVELRASASRAAAQGLQMPCDTRSAGSSPVGGVISVEHQAQIVFILDTPKGCLPDSGAGVQLRTAAGQHQVIKF